jgi:NAD(P)-dependent dehydrogenase (short-subunit alcohol dehydrogenase family)
VALGATAAVAASAIAYSRYRANRARIADHSSASSSTTSDQVAAAYPKACIGKTFVVTGASSGIGEETARVLFANGGRVIMAVRNLQTGQLAADRIRQRHPDATGSLECMHLDLASLNSVREFAAQLMAANIVLDGLINNAGVFQQPGQTEDDFQIVWQTNALAPALLTHLLMPLFSSQCRVVNVSSQLHELWGGHSVTDACPPSSSGDSYSDYGLSKACQILHATWLNHFFHSTSSQCTAYAVEPGLIRTNIMRLSSSWIVSLNYALMSPIVKSVEQGAATTLYCMLADPVPQPGYYADCAAKKARDSCTDLQEAQVMQEIFEQLW